MSSLPVVSAVLRDLADLFRHDTDCSLIGLLASLRLLRSRFPVLTLLLRRDRRIIILPRLVRTAHGEPGVLLAVLHEQLVGQHTGRLSPRQVVGQHDGGVQVLDLLDVGSVTHGRLERLSAVQPLLSHRDIMHVHRDISVLPPSGTRLHHWRLLLRLRTLPTGRRRVGLVLVNIRPRIIGHLRNPTESHTRIKRRVIIQNSRHRVLFPMLSFKRLNPDRLPFFRADRDEST